MNYSDFYDWLISNNGMSERSARDVVSRSKRALTITKQTKIDENTMKKLIASSEFSACSMSIKSQLKRATTLYLDFIKK